MNQVQSRQDPAQLTLTGDKLPIIIKDPNKDLSVVEQKIYRFIFKLGPKTELEIRNHPGFHEILDIGRALRRMRSKGFVKSRKQRDGPQLWEAIL